MASTAIKFYTGFHNSFCAQPKFSFLPAYGNSKLIRLKQRYIISTNIRASAQL